MDIKSGINILAAACFAINCIAAAPSGHPSDYVNMLIGTTGSHPTEYGGTVPAVSQPFGMTQWCAATRINGISRTMYHHEDTTLIGFMGTHQPAIWMGDYGYFTMMPQVDTLRLHAGSRAVRFERSEEKCTPYYYRIGYEDGGKPVTTEFTATSRCSFFRITYPGNGKGILFIEAGRGNDGGKVEIDEENMTVRLLNRERHDSHLGPQLYDFACRYVLEFNIPFSSYGTWKDDSISPGKSAEEGSFCGCYLEFDSPAGTVEIRAGSSFISYAQAEENLSMEIPEGTSFEELVSKVKESWDSQLGNISVEGAGPDDLAVLYTAYFRTLQFPREFSEYGRYYSPFDEKIHEGISYSAYSLWDTFRAQHPWLQLMCPERVGPMMQSLVNMYKESGWIPKWPNPTFTNIMIGTHADAVIADAYINGFRDFDAETAYQAIRKDAFVPPDKDGHYRWGDRDYWTGCYEARGGLRHYIEKGYVASDLTDESVARTLEFALDDYCIARMAEATGHIDDYLVLSDRAGNYRNLYNPESKFFQAKKSDGRWVEDADEGFTEGANWTYRFCVMQDVPGLIDIMGGEEYFMEALDSNFDDGHYRHDNEPGHHYAYLYNWCGRLDKTQMRIRHIIDENYRNSPDGLSGNDDLGQMSAWYLFSAMGFYPLQPASGKYALGIPRFRKMTLDLKNGRTLVIKADHPEKNQTLTDVYFNGKRLTSPFIGISEIWSGGVLEFKPAGRR